MLTRVAVSLQHNCLSQYTKAEATLVRRLQSNDEERWRANMLKNGTEEAGKHGDGVC